MRRTNAQLQSAAASALEKAYGAAHSQYAGRAQEMERELEVARCGTWQAAAASPQQAWQSPLAPPLQVVDA
jgi:hypothetical protein